MAPTLGFDKQEMSSGKYKLDVFDLGGGKNVRRLWKTYLSELHGVVFVLDAANPSRFAEAKKALEDSLAQDHLKGKSILVLANKQDLPTAVPSHEAAVALGLAQDSNSPSVSSSSSLAVASGCSFNILACSALSSSKDHRMNEGMRWLVDQIHKSYPELNKRVQNETELVRAEEARKKKEREEAVRKIREERQRKQQEEEEEAAKLAAAAAAAKGPIEAAETLVPHQNVTPKKAQEDEGPSKEGFVNASYDGTPSAPPKSTTLASNPSSATNPPPEEKAIFSDLLSDKREDVASVKGGDEPSSTPASASNGSHSTRPGSAAKKPPVPSPVTSVISTGPSSSLGGGGGGGKLVSNGSGQIQEVTHRTSSTTRPSNKIVPVA